MNSYGVLWINGAIIIDVCAISHCISCVELHNWQFVIVIRVAFLIKEVAMVLYDPCCKC
jgi:hypothetical protein